jgi:hypothetical protein
MNRYILIREEGSQLVTVVDKKNGSVEEIDPAEYGIDLEGSDNGKQPHFAGIAAAAVISEGTDFSARFHYRA